MQCGDQVLIQYSKCGLTNVIYRVTLIPSVWVLSVCLWVCLWVCLCVVDSSNLEIFLEMLNDGEIVIVVSHDEASTKYVMSFCDVLLILDNEMSVGSWVRRVILWRLINTR